jgi:uncharacterized membrane protein
MTDISPAPISAAGDDRTLPAVTYALYLLGLATCVTALVGVVLAYISRDAASERMRTHYTFLIRTFWMSIGWFLAGGLVLAISIPLSVILIGIPGMVLGGALMALTGVFFAVRSIVGVIFLAQGEPYPRPNTWLI